MELYQLRSFEPKDIDSLVQYANNINIARWLTDQFPHPYTREAGEQFIEMARSGDPLSIFTIDIDGNASGGIGLHLQKDIYCKNAEMGYWLAEPFWGRGIVTAAVCDMVRYGFDNFDITRIYARPFGNNVASRKVLEKAGFTLEARFKDTLFKNGEFLDECIYAIRR